MSLVKVEEAKRCDSCNRELTEDQADTNYLLNLPMLFCPRCYQIKDLIINGPQNNKA